VGKKRSALVELHRMLREGEIDKRYLALVKGGWTRKDAELRESLHKYVTDSGERRVAVREDGQAAATRVRPLKVRDAFSLLELRLLTGRTHQIRVHLAHAGHPVLGDDKYGDFDLNKTLVKSGVRRLFLHACAIAFMHPTEKRKLKFESKMPDDMKRFADKALG
jgi:23S rRNA pseudouridine955/2504/2580 synthase